MTNRSVKIHDVKWGTEKSGGTRVMTSESGLMEPLKWDRRLAKSLGNHAPSRGVEMHALKNGLRERVFCGSLCDWAETWNGPILNHKGEQLFKSEGGEVTTCVDWTEPLTMSHMRKRLGRTIDATRDGLDWLLLTKRPQDIPAKWEEMKQPWVGEDLPILGLGAKPSELATDYRQNVWLGASAGNQDTLDRFAPHLIAARHLSPILFLSLEPLFDRVDVSPYLDSIDWVIVGGESNTNGQKNARACNVQWIRDVIAQCEAYGVPCFVKQLGSNIAPVVVDGGSVKERMFLKHPKGGDPEEWAEDLRVFQFPIPKVRAA